MQSLLECKTDQMASSHQIKRFFGKLSCITGFVFNKILNELFIWRLHISSPQVIELGINTMVLDNDGAVKREGSTSERRDFSLFIYAGARFW